MSENCSELIISPENLADIRAQCLRRAAELEAAGELQRLPIAPGRAQNDFPALPAPLPISEAEHFAAAVSEMPPRVRAFFALEDPVPPHRRESAEEREERKLRESFGGWCG
jgi:hypothetical protein